MKILHINYSDKSGGAGIAAYRHNEAMNRIGLNSNMLVVLKMTRDNTIYVLRKNRVQLQVLDNLYNFLHSFVIRRFKPRADFCYALLLRPLRCRLCAKRFWGSHVSVSS